MLSCVLVRERERKKLTQTVIFSEMADEATQETARFYIKKGP